MMRIAMPVERAEMSTEVCVSFGRAPYFLIYETDTKEAEFITNTAVSSAGGAGIQAAQVIVDHKADVLLTPRCGQNAVDVLEGGGVKLYKTANLSAQTNIDEFEKGNLALLGQVHPGFHGRGGN